MQKGSGQSQPLPLAAGEGIAQLADLGVIALGKTHDKIVDGGLLAGGDDFFLRGIQLGDAEVFPDGVVEQVSLLGHEALHIP